jgi:hypothetical protein
MFPIGVVRHPSLVVDAVHSFFPLEVPMFAPRISVILFSVVLVGASLFTRQLLFARGENGGDVCHPGEIVPYTSDTPQPNPPGPPWTRVEE